LASKDDTGGTYSVIEIKVFPNGGPIPQWLFLKLSSSMLNKLS
jgi:hypothetical protein